MPTIGPRFRSRMMLPSLSRYASYLYEGHAATKPRPILFYTEDHYRDGRWRCRTAVAAPVYRHRDPEGGVHADVQRGARLRVRPGRLGALSACHSKSVLYGGFVWARSARSRPKRRFPAI